MLKLKRKSVWVGKRPSVHSPTLEPVWSVSHRRHRFGSSFPPCAVLHSSLSRSWRSPWWARTSLASRQGRPGQCRRWMCR